MNSRDIDPDLGVPLEGMRAPVALGFNAKSGALVEDVLNRHHAMSYGRDVETGWRSVLVPQAEITNFITDLENVPGVSDIHGRDAQEGCVKLPEFLRRYRITT